MRRLHEPQGHEVQQRREVAVLEDPDQGAEAGQDRQRVHDQRLERQHHRAQQQEQHEVGRDEDEQRRARERPGATRSTTSTTSAAPPPTSTRRPAGGASGLGGSRRSRTSARASGWLLRVAGDDREGGQVVVGRRGEGLRDGPVAGTRGVAQEQLVLLPASAAGRCPRCCPPGSPADRRRGAGTSRTAGPRSPGRSPGRRSCTASTSGANSPSGNSPDQRVVGHAGGHVRWQDRCVRGVEADMQERRPERDQEQRWSGAPRARRGP